MSIMPLDLDLLTAAHRRMKAHPLFTQLVLDGVIGTDALDSDNPSDRIEQSHLFQGLDGDGRPFRDPEATGKCVIVLAERTSWANPNQHNTLDFPRLQMLIYADSTRSEDGSVATWDAERKCRHVDTRLHRVFHLPGNDVHHWDDLYVISSLGGSGLTIMDVPGTQSGAVRGERLYNVELG